MDLALKDDGLSFLADAANVAQFTSFAPGAPPLMRHSRLQGYEPDDPFESPEAAIGELLRLSADNSVNVRTFHPDDPKSKDFHYGLTTIDEAAALVRSHAINGMYTIVNETIDIHDGGVSGVMLGGVIEFAPDDTPRCVEKPGTLAMMRHEALALLDTVYGMAPDLSFDPEQRIEFSFHPQKVGVRRTHTIIWEIENVGPIQLEAHLGWPNRFSRHVGDKAFGLLVADVLGLPVPHTTVVSRAIAPFRFGKTTGSDEVWLRTCPKEQIPGKFTTVRGWRDPFGVMARDDPDGTRISSILAQQQVDARYSGATLPEAGEDHLVEGVTGFGDVFMTGRTAPIILPKEIQIDVEALAVEASARLGPVRIEWAHDGEHAWILQMHLAADRASGATIYPGTPAAWRAYDPNLGLDALRHLIWEVHATGDGIIVTGQIGITSHVGDLLRKAAVPARLGPDTEVPTTS